MKQHQQVLLQVLVLSLALAGGSLAGELTVVGTNPAARTVGAPVDGAVSVEFDRAVRAESLIPGRTFWAFGRWSGAVTGDLVLSNGDKTVSLIPDRPLSAGESVMVIVSHDVEAVDGGFVRDGGWSFQFWTRAAPAALELIEVQRMTTRTIPSETSQAYGGIGTDLDGDGFLDLTIVNEDTSDLRVFMNKSDGTGTFDAFSQPTFPTGSVPSPSEPSDFNGDGHADIAVANILGNSVSILLGNGDGTFGPHQEIAVGTRPRGIAVLDADGDGDVDVVNTNSGTSNLSVLLNDGNGVFGAPSFFGSGNATEWALVAADFDEDGILDLAAGGQTAARIDVYSGVGDGTFAFTDSQASGGRTWMLSTGDLNGDGHADLAAVNSFDDHGAILLGDGTGALAAPVAYPTDPFALATDLGDLDGDGDLDWVTSSFSGDWFLFLNDGLGNFTLDRQLLAPQAASCALALDIDNDGDLDLALVDEIEDEVIVLANGGLFGDGFESGDLSAWALVAP